jgi:MFS family permease
MLLAYFVGIIGNFTYSTALGWLVLTLTNSPGLLAIATAAQNTPNLVLSIVGGALADQVDRRKLLVRAQLSGAVFATGLAVLTMTGGIAYWQIIVLAFLAGSVQAISYPSIQSILPTVVDRRAIGNAIALNSVSFNVARILGPAAAGLAIAAGGLVLGFWANALGFLFVARIIRGLSFPARPGGRSQAGLWANLLAGLRYVRSTPMLRLLVPLAGVPALFVLNIFTFLPVSARDILEIGAPGLGLLLSAVGIGALIGAGSYAVVLPGGGSARLMLAGLGLVGITLTAFAVSGWLPISLLALLLYGAAQVGFYSTVQSLLQVLAAPEMRGRVMSLYLFMALGVLPIGNVLAGLVAERFGVQVALGGGGVITFALVAAVWVASPALRRLRPEHALELETATS